MSAETLDISEARRRFNTLDSDLETRPVIYITRHNKNAFAVVEIEYLETILETMEIITDPESHRMFMESLEDIKQGRVHDHDDVERELG